VPLPVFTGSCPIPQPNWRYDVINKDLYRLQPLHKVIQRLLHGGLTDADLLHTFFSHPIQLLCQREMTMWMCPEPTCSDCPFSEELGYMEINTQIRGILAHGDRSESWLQPHPFKGRGQQPLGEFAQTHFQLFVPISVSQCMHVLVQGLGCARSAPRWVTLPEDVAR
jgi:hypothetical protein